MNLPKQSRPVIRDVSKNPIKARVQAALNGGGGVLPPAAPDLILPPFNWCNLCLGTASWEYCVRSGACP